MSVLRVVSIGSRSGAYGGPFDTAKRQVSLAQVAGIQARLWAGSLPEDAPDPGLLPEGTVIVPVRSWVPRLGFASAISWGAVRSLAREVRGAEVVHVSFSREMVPVVASLFAVMWRKRLIIQPHGMLTSRSSRLHRLVDIAVRPLFKASTAVVALTDVERADLASWLQGATMPSCTVLGNPVGRLEGVTPEVRIKPIAREALWVARLHPRKRVQDFLKASAISRRNCSEISFTVVGPDGGQLPEVLASCRGEGNLVYEGAMTAEDVTRRVNSTGVFVLTSSNEPWGNVLATALSLGIPVVVSQSSALSEAIARYGAGRVVPDAQPNEIEAAIRELLDDNVAYKSHSAGALQLADHLLSEPAQSKTLTVLYAPSLVK